MILAGHYPWQAPLDEHLLAVRDAHPGQLLLWGIDPKFWDESLKASGDHAARDETSMGLALFPELVDMDALYPHADLAAAWPGGRPVKPAGEWKTPTFDAASKLFSQWWPEGGQDATHATPAHGERLAGSMVENIDVVAVAASDCSSGLTGSALRSLVAARFPPCERGLATGTGGGIGWAPGPAIRHAILENAGRGHSSVLWGGF